MDGGALRAKIHEITKSQTRLSDYHFHFFFFTSYLSFHWEDSNSDYLSLFSMLLLISLPQIE